MNIATLNNKVTRNPVKATVLSISHDKKTAKVLIPRLIADNLYKKRIHTSTIMFADCSKFQSLEVNSVVEIFPCKRISKFKTWKVIRGGL